MKVKDEKSKNEKSKKGKPKAVDRLKRLKKEAAKDLSVAGTVQFRVDEETMILLMRAADQKKVPLGTLVRMWTVERLAAEGYQ